MINHMRIKSLLLLIVFFGVFLLATQPVSAQSPQFCAEEAGSFLDFPTWYKYLDPEFVDGECKLNVAIPESLPKILLAVFEILLRVAGILAVVFVVVGGFQYLITTGEPDKAKGARTTIINALVGLVIAMLATAVVNLIGNNIT